MNGTDIEDWIGFKDVFVAVLMGKVFFLAHVFSKRRIQWRDTDALRRGY